MTNRDLLGNEIESESYALADELRAYDQNTFDERLSRLAYLHRVFPENYSFLMSVSAHYLFDEARRAFVNGDLVSTVLLAQAFIDNWLQAQLESKGYEFGRSKQGLRYILDLVGAENLNHGFLIEQIDGLLKLRNPFVHLRPFDDPHDISRRAVDAHVAPDQLLEQDAKEALSLMYQIAITRI